MTFRSLLALTLFAVVASAQNRIPGSIDPNRVVVLPGHVHPLAAPRFDQGQLPASTPMRGLTLYLKPSPALDQFLTELQLPSSPNYHRWLTPEQFGGRFGLSAAELASVTAWLESQGLRVDRVARGRHWIDFHGAAGDIGAAFHSSIHRYSVNGETHFANATDPSIPAALAGVVAGIHGLHDFRPKSFAVRSNIRPDYNLSGQHYVVPDDFAVIYNLQPLYSAGADGTGQTIAIVGGSPIDQADIATFRNRFHLSPINLQPVVVGPTPPKSTDVLLEADLDIEWSSAVARNAQIVYVYADDPYAAGQYAVDQNLAPVVSFSFGDCEIGPVTAFRSVVQQANAQGITWVVASGDGGAATCDYQSSPTPQATKGASVAFPASVPEVTAVGGTEFNEGTANVWSAANGANFVSALSYIPEAAWNDSAQAFTPLGGGGGASALFGKPLWQTGPGVPGDGARDVPDVSFNSSPFHDPYWVNSGGSAYGVGGTSVAAPVFAGIVALLNQQQAAAGNTGGLGNINPALYGLARTTTDVFHDVVTGDIRVPCQQGTPGCVDGMLGYAAAPGYDLATGLGSIDVARFLAEWNTGKASATSLHAPAGVTLTGSIDLTATVTAVNGGGAPPSGTVTFLANDASLGVAALKASGSAAAASLTTTANQLPVGANTITAVYSGDSVFTSSDGTAAVTVNLPASGAAVVPSVDPNPIYGQPLDAAGPVWAYNVTLSEKAGVAATLTAFTIDGKAQSLAPFGGGKIRAGGALTVLINERGVSTPANRLMVFSGTDAGGQAWTQQLLVPFSGPVITPAILLSSSPVTVQQNPQNDPSCQYKHRLTVEEQDGYQVSLTRLTAGSDFSKQIQSLFGTTRLAPFGILQADFCASAAGNRTIQISGFAEDGTSISASAAVTYAAPAAAPAIPSVATAVVDVPASGSAKLDLKFTTGTAAWTASLLPANRTTTWLSVSPLSGTGPAQLTLKGSAAGLSNGVYNAVLSIQFANSIPQSIDVPVTMTVGGSGSVTIAGIANNASGGAAFAPGMQVAVFGSGLSPGTAVATTRPLPLAMLGVSATVNGITAPLYYISDQQIDLQIPYETPQGTAVLAINNNGKVASYNFPMSVAAPGAFNVILNNSTRGAIGAGTGGDVMTLYITGDGDVTPTLATGAAPASNTPLSRLPQPRMTVGVTVGGIPATVNFVGITSGLVGVTQINFTIPDGPPAGDQPVVVTVGSVPAPPIKLIVN